MEAFVRTLVTHAFQQDKACLGRQVPVGGSKPLSHNIQWLWDNITHGTPTGCVITLQVTAADTGVTDTVKLGHSDP